MSGKEGKEKKNLCNQCYIICTNVSRKVKCSCNRLQDRFKNSNNFVEG